MHTHMWSEDHRGSLTGAPTGLREEIDYQDHLDWAAKLYPGRAFHMLVLGTPMPGMDAAGHNAWMAAQLAADPESAINMMVTPDMTPEYVAAQVDEYGFLGLKPYRTFAPDPVGARICDFLPESPHRSRPPQEAGHHHASRQNPPAQPTRTTSAT